MMSKRDIKKGLKYGTSTAMIGSTLITPQVMAEAMTGVNEQIGNMPEENSNYKWTAYLRWIYDYILKAIRKYFYRVDNISNTASVQDVNSEARTKDMGDDKKRENALTEKAEEGQKMDANGSRENRFEETTNKTRDDGLMITEKQTNTNANTKKYKLPTMKNGMISQKRKTDEVCESKKTEKAQEKNSAEEHRKKTMSKKTRN